jgi:hypothetical protein
MGCDWSGGKHSWRSKSGQKISGHGRRRHSRDGLNVPRWPYQSICGLADDPEVEMMQNWLPIDTAPKDGTPILVFGAYFQASDLRYSFVWIVKWTQAEREESAGDGLYRRVMRGLWGTPPCEFYPTHWMPLPAAPSTIDAGAV